MPSWTPKFCWELTADCKIRLKDETAWGVGGAPARNTVLVEFSAYYIRSNTERLEVQLPQNPVLVTEVIVPTIHGDGDYEVVMEVFNMEGDFLKPPIRYRILIMCSLKACFCRLDALILDATCGCEPDKLFDLIGKIRVIMDGSATLYSVGDYEMARQLLEYGGGLCASFGKSSGGCGGGCGGGCH